MRKSIIVTFLIFTLMLVMTSSALAEYKSKKGNSTGGLIASAEVTAKLNYTTGTTYSVSASTSSTKTGKCYAKVTLYFNSTSDSSSKTVQSGKSVTTGAVGSQGYKATRAISQHSYTSENFGSWSCSLTQDF